MAEIQSCTGLARRLDLTEFIILIVYSQIRISREPYCAAQPVDRERVAMRVSKVRRRSEGKEWSENKVRRLACHRASERFSVSLRSLRGSR